MPNSSNSTHEIQAIVEEVQGKYLAHTAGNVANTVSQTAVIVSGTHNPDGTWSSNNGITVIVNQTGYYNDRIIDDEIKSFQVEVGKEL